MRDAHDDRAAFDAVALSAANRRGGKRAALPRVPTREHAERDACRRRGRGAEDAPLSTAFLLLDTICKEPRHACLHSILSAGRARCRAPAWLALATVVLAGLLWAHGPIGQWADYHAFADDRAWLGLPNAANVLSNLPFLAVGVWALWRAAPGAGGEPVARRLAGLRAGAGAHRRRLVGLSLGALERQPGRRPAADRLGLRRPGLGLPRRTRRHALEPGAHRSSRRSRVATLSVAFWWLTERAGQGDLRLYLFVQFLPMLLVPLGLGLGLKATTPTATPARAWWAVLGCYAAAKLFEMADRAVFVSLGGLSGHTLKHLVAAAGAAWLLRAVVRAQTLGRQLR